MLDKFDYLHTVNCHFLSEHLSMSKSPWDYHEDLSRDRLQLIAKSLRDIRKATLLLHDPAAGDGPWSLGCRIHERSGELLIRASETMWPWLTVVSSTLDYTFAVGAVPVRFYHGAADKPGEQHLKFSLAEQRQGNFAFGDAAVDLLWRIAVETNIAGQTENVILIGVTPNGDVECRYVIPPLADSVSFLVPSRTSERPPVRLQPPRVRPRHRPSKERKDDDGRNQPV